MIVEIILPMISVLTVIVKEMNILVEIVFLMISVPKVIVREMIMLVEIILPMVQPNLFPPLLAGATVILSLHLALLMIIVVVMRHH